MKRSIFLGALVCILSIGSEVNPVLAADAQLVGVADVTVVTNGEGASRVLFRLPVSTASERTIVKKAILTVPFTGAPEEKSLELRICPVTEAWPSGASWSTEFDADVFAPARVDLGSGSGSATFDLTVLLKEVLEDDLTSDGFVLVSGSQVVDGLTGDDADRFETLEGAQLQLVTTILPTGRPVAAAQGE